jgi:hypothetical protein
MSRVLINFKKKYIAIDEVTLEKQSNGGFNFYLKINCKNYVDLIKRTSYCSVAQRGYDSKGKPKTIIKTVNSVKQGMMEGKDIKGTTVINIRKRENVQQFIYDEKARTLLIGLNEELFLVDGYNRKTGCLKYIEETGNIPENYWKIEIHNVSLDEEKIMFADLNTNRTNASQSKTHYLSDSPQSDFIRDLLEESILGNYVEIDNDSTPRKSKNIITFYNIHQSLFGRTTGYRGAFANIDLNNPIERNDLKDYLLRFLDHLYTVRIELMFETFEEKCKLKTKYVLLDSNFFSNMFFIASKLYKTKDWENQLTKILTTKVKGTPNGKRLVDFWGTKNKIYWETIIDKDGKIRVGKSSNRTEIAKSIYKKFFEKDEAETLKE